MKNREKIERKITENHNLSHQNTKQDESSFTNNMKNAKELISWKELDLKVTSKPFKRNRQEKEAYKYFDKTYELYRYKVEEKNGSECLTDRVSQRQTSS